MNIARVTPPFGTKVQSKNEFHFQPNSLFVRNFHWTRAVANTKPLQKKVDHHLDESRLQLHEMTFSGLNQPPI